MSGRLRRIALAWILRNNLEVSGSDAFASGPVYRLQERMDIFNANGRSDSKEKRRLLSF